MNKFFGAGFRIVSLALALTAPYGNGADTPGNLITNGGFEAGMQIWRGDGKAVLLPDGNRVCEIEASKIRMKDITQEFHMKQLQQVEVVFRARSNNYTGPGIRVSIHQHGSGALFWNEQLPGDGAWREIHIKYTRTTANADSRELVIATLLGTGKIQIDDVEVREPIQLGENQPLPPTATPMARQTTPLVQPKPLTPPASVKPAAITPPPAANPQPALQIVPPGTFTSLEQILSSAPADAVRKLLDKETADAGAADMNAYFAQNLKNKPVVLHIKVEISEPVSTGQNKYRVRAPDRPVGTAAININGRVWVYFPNTTASGEGQAPVGSEITVSGVLGRCDITTKANCG